jgi:hypothetical protein
MVNKLGIYEKLSVLTKLYWSLTNDTLAPCIVFVKSFLEDFRISLRAVNILKKARVRPGLCDSFMPLRQLYSIQVIHFHLAAQVYAVLPEYIDGDGEIFVAAQRSGAVQGHLGLYEFVELTAIVHPF